MLCPQCSRTAGDNDAFCSGCGMDLRGKTSQPLLKGERRTATVLFSDLSGYTALGEALDPEEVAQIIGEIKSAATRIIEIHGGTVNQFAGDEVMALFGIPVSHDDDARRAVAAGLELQSWVSALAGRYPTLPVPLAMHTGIQSGLVVAEARDAREGLFTATGDAVNTAARLLSAAGPNELYVGPETEAQLAGFFDVQAVGSLSMKGKAAPLATHKVLRASLVHSRFEAKPTRRRTRLHGRAAEMSMLFAALAEAVEQGRFVAISGVAGVGKSRLAHNFCDQAAAKGVRVLRGSCQAFGQIEPYRPFVEALRRVLRVEDQDTGHEIEARLIGAAKAIGGDLTPHIPVLLRLLSVSSDDDGQADELASEEVPRLICDALAAAITALGALGPIVLHLEDWHWADEASRSALPLICRQLVHVPVLLLIDHRPDTGSNWATLPALAISLEQLDRAAADELVAECLQAEVVQVELLDLIRARTEGNPLFIEEICTSLQSRGVLALRGREIGVVGHIAELRIPRSVQAVLQSRIDELAPATRDVLRRASVIGPVVERRVLQGLVDSDATLAEVLPQLHETDLLLSDDAEPGRLRFRHVTVQEVAYESMLKRERSELHGQVGVLLESLYVGDRHAEVIDSLAHHFQRAGRQEKALGYLREAGFNAARRFAFARARDCLGEAIAIHDARGECNERVALTLRWAELNLFGPSLGQIPSLQRARDLAREANDQAAVVSLSYWISWVYYAVGDQDRAIRILEPLAEAVGASGNTGAQATMLAGLGHAYAVARDPRASTTIDKALELFALGANGHQPHQRGSGVALATFTACQRALLQAYAGEVETCHAGFRDAIARIRLIANLPTESSNWITYGSAQVQIGDWQGAVSSAREARRIAEYMRSPYHLDTADTIEGYALCRLGEQRRGEILLRQGIDALQVSGMHLSLSLSLACLADVLADRGEYDEARALVKQALMCSARGERLGEDLALRAQLRIHAAEGSERVETLVAELRDHALRSGSARDIALAGWEIARCLRDPEARITGTAAAETRIAAMGMADYVRATPVMRVMAASATPS